jgi:hypothetical protein
VKNSFVLVTAKNISVPIAENAPNPTALLIALPFVFIEI